VYVLPGLGDLQANDLLQSADFYDRRVQVYSAVVNGKLGDVDLTSVTGYNINEFQNSSDRTPTYTNFAQSNFGVRGAALSTPGKTDKLTQELRGTVPFGDRVDLLLGGFYTREKSRIDQSLVAIDTRTGAAVGTLLTAATPREYKEYAGFADLTVRFTDRFDIQFGGRESEIKQDFSQRSVGPLAGASGVAITPERTSKANVFTYLVTPKFKISPDVMAYARFASGYRPGVANITLNTAIPPASNPDRTKNYELGAKADLFGGALSLDASLFYIDWTDIQLLLVNPVNRFSYQTNGSRAKSQGVELSVVARPRSGTTIDAWLVFNDAVLTEDIPTSNSARGLSGDRLPNSSRVSGSLALQQAFPIGGDLTALVRAAVSYIGNSVGVFTQTAARQPFGGYAKTDLSAGVQYDSWAVDLYANNLADRRGAVGGGTGTTPPFAFSYIQPRTIGLTVSKTF
jgi:outer membrane receptor protein involved in Fe transport